MTTFRDSAALMAARLRVFQRLQLQARERGDLTVELHVEELFEPSDVAALDAYERDLAAHMGQVPLGLEMSA